jgi:cyanate lyase
MLKRHYKNVYGRPLKLYTEERYVDGFFLNVDSLYRYKAKPIKQIESEALDKIATKQLPFAELKATLAVQKMHASTAFRLLAHRAFQWDMNIELNDNTLLEVA